MKKQFLKRTRFSFYVVYHATATGTWSPGTVHWQSRWLAGMCHCNDLWPTGSAAPVGHRPLHAKWRRRVGDL